MNQIHERRAVVTGVGMVTALGDDLDDIWRSLLAGKTAARRWDDLAAEGFPVTTACRIPGDVGASHPTWRGRAMGQAAAQQALADAGLGGDDRRAGIGVFVGTTMGESAGFEAAAQTGGVPVVDAGGQIFVAHLKSALRLDGPSRTYATACAAGNYAIGAAAQAVVTGPTEVVLAGGIEPFSRIALLGFARLRAMATDACRPFDAQRTGMQLGEAAAFLVVEEETHARRRGATSLAVVGGLGLSGDAHHPTAPRTDGSGMAAAMLAGLEASGLTPEDVGWVNAHGTGTVPSDAAEARAVSRVFADRAPPVSSLKGAFGHSLGAATAVEAVASVLALQTGMLPPTANFDRIDPELTIDVIAAARPAPDLRWVMNCGYAFGGLNSALLIGAA